MKILVSSCLLGDKVRYSGSDSMSSIDDMELFDKILSSNEIFSICPEVSSGLPTPREAAEQKANKVVSKSNKDFTYEFNLGAKIALEICIKNNIHVALLKSKSPSCGTKKVYDGTFSSTLIDGLGVTAKLLKENSIKLFDETQLIELNNFIINNN
ncbi:hypothetical protein CPU12_09445 [Malaciobacter molluscorum LMG 25693]|uniref:DUF523 domain-containing protein n=1 Tax=Malaciobacter molluscorum LMG 25693 TaxID=870501 RepID=A0A2G1DGT2_9BACT|nr:DUF523 domain-containing protein [Malaciobacter molluscorum]AXX92476.1 DUF523 domain-containing protein [Malaciobacter molluscorum LMG 25693]PHO17654.1 hypothetical protein CPU12_09445 [Malaciobacter molluscorum LMG 25693]